MSLVSFWQMVFVDVGTKQYKSSYKEAELNRITLITYSQVDLLNWGLVFDDSRVQLLIL